MTLATISRERGAVTVAKGRGIIVKIIHPVICCITLALTAGASTAPAAEDDFPLNGSYTQNIPCKGDGSDPPKLQLKISTQQIDSKVGICTFLDTKRNGKNIDAHLECRFPAGPLIGDVTFTLQSDNTVKFVDRDQNYRSVLYRCPQ